MHLPRITPWAFAAFGVLFAGLASPVHGDANSEFEQRRNEERKNSDAMLANVSHLDERNISSVLRIGVENKAVRIRTTLRNTEREGFMQVKIADLGVIALIRVTGAAPTDSRPAGPAAAIVPKVLQFQFTDYRKPLQISTLAVTLQATGCTINKSSQFPGGGYANTCLTQQGSDVAGGGSVQLTVNEAGREGVAPVNLSLDAVDFFSFVRAYPAETDAYLRPMFHELGQEGVFAPDAFLAWQVFTELWTPDPAMNSQVNALLPALDQDDFRTRDQAVLDLEKLGRAGAAALMHLDRRRLTPEQNSRIDLPLTPYPQLSMKDAERLRSDPAFLLDCLYSEDLPLRKAALGQLRAVSDQAVEFDVTVNRDSRAKAVEGLRKKVLGGEK